MRDIIARVFTFNGLSLLIGVIGGLFGIVSIFIDWSAQISVKSLAGTIVVFVFSTLILVKIILDAAHKIKTHSSGKFKVTNIVLQGGELVLLTKNSLILPTHTRVSLYYIDDTFEVYFAEAYVYHIQDEFTQIKISKFDDDFKSNYPDALEAMYGKKLEILNKLIIRNIVKIS